MSHSETPLDDNVPTAQVDRRTLVKWIAATGVSMASFPLFASHAMAAQPVDRNRFTNYFTSIAPQDITGNVFTMVGKDYYVITAGTPERYNSMVASWGGWGIIFNAPTVWAFLRANRFTLDFIRESQSFTCSFFPETYREKFMLFGNKSGRNTKKMEEHTLQAVLTPGGRIAYAEARLVIECDLSQITTVSPDDFLFQSSDKFVREAYAEAGEYHKESFGNKIDVMHY